MSEVRTPGPNHQDRTRTILSPYAHLDEIQGYDFGQANVKPTEAVARADDQAISYTRIRRFDGNVANNVKLVPAPFRIELAQGGLADAPSKNVPGTDMPVHAFDFAPPILGRLAPVVGVVTSDGIPGRSCS